MKIIRVTKMSVKMIVTMMNENLDVEYTSDNDVNKNDYDE